MQTLGPDRVWAIPLPDAMRIKRVFLIHEKGRCRFLGDSSYRAEMPSNLSRFEDSVILRSARPSPAVKHEDSP